MGWLVWVNKNELKNIKNIRIICKMTENSLN